MTDEIIADSGFTYRRRGEPDAGRAIVALHGSGADETSMLPLAAAIDPQALVIAPRGRVDQNGERRWFLKHTPTDFDQRSIRTESKAFAGFLAELYEHNELDPQRTVFLGYSNGASLVHSTMLLHPGLIMRAVLLRCMPVLKRPPRCDLGSTPVLVVAGEHDQTYGRYAPALVRLLERRSAKVTFSVVSAGHEFGDQDVVVVRQWLSTC